MRKLQIEWLEQLNATSLFCLLLIQLIRTSTGIEVGSKPSIFGTSVGFQNMATTTKIMIMTMKTRIRRRITTTIIVVNNLNNNLCYCEFLVGASGAETGKRIVTMKQNQLQKEGINIEPLMTK